MPLVAGFALVLLVLGVAAVFLMGLRNHDARIRLSLNIQADAWALRSAAAEAGSRQRLMYLTGEARFQRDVDMAIASMRYRLERLEQYPKSPSLVERMPSLRQAALARIEELERGRGPPTDIKREALLARAPEAARLFDRIVADVDMLVTVEQAELAAARRRAGRLTAAFLLLLLGGVVAATAVGSGVVRRLVADRRALDNALAEVRALAQDLEERVALRTAELSEANEELQRFAYIVSHDLRAPLVNVMGFTAELRHAEAKAKALVARVAEAAPGLVDEETRLVLCEDFAESLEFIQASTERMDRLIAAILAISREGQRELSPEPVDLARMVAEIGDSLRSQFEDAGAKLVVGPLPAIETDPLALEQILGNLVDNAIKYLRPDTPGEVRVEGRSRGSRVEIEVADNGRGIAVADQPRVFELFRRAGAQDRPGHGVGLAQVQTLVKGLGGRITVDSRPGEGSRFTLDLPARLEGRPIHS